MIGATGDENTPGPIIRGGEFGFFVEQRLVTAGKLGKSRNIAEQERLQAETTAQAQKLPGAEFSPHSLLRGIRCRTPGSGSNTAGRAFPAAVKISKELLNVGAADRPDLLESEIEAERAEVNLALAKTAQTRVWRELAAVVANPSLQPAPLEGNLEEVPRLELEAAMSKLFSESPEIRNSEVTVAREEAALQPSKGRKDSGYLGSRWFAKESRALGSGRKAGRPGGVLRCGI